MISFVILLILLLAFAIVAAIVLVIGGGSFIAIFGDLLVCALIVWAIVRSIAKLRKWRKRRRARKKAR